MQPTSTPVTVNPTGAPILPGQNLGNPAPNVGTTLLQDQQKAANQGKPGFDILGNPVATPTSTTSSNGVTGTTPTTLSGDKSQTIDQNNQNLNNKNQSVAANQAAQFTGALEKYSDGTPVTAPTGATQQTDENGNTWYTYGGKNYAVGPDTSLSPEQQSNQDQLTKLQNQSDSLFASAISGIKAMYEALIAKQKVVNTGAESANAQSLLMGGTSRYAQTDANNNQQAEISFGITQIADLTAKENDAIQAANVAKQTNDMAIVDKKLALADKLTTQKQAALTKLQDALTVAQKDATAKAQQKSIDDAVTAQLSSGVTDPTKIAQALSASGISATSKQISDTLANLTPDAAAVHNVMLEASKNGASASILKSIGSAKTVSDAINAAGDSLQTATGQMGDYLNYKRNAEANGLPVQDYGTWKKADDANTVKQKSAEAYATAFASASGKAAADAKYSASTVTSPITSPLGIVYQAPASIAPYASFSANGVKYVDLSQYKGTPTEAHQAVQDAQAAGYKVITDKNTANDIQNITDATSKLNDMKKDFLSVAPDSALKRNTWQSAAIAAGKLLQTNPSAVSNDVYVSAALDILKAESGTRGFRGGASVVDAVSKILPQNSDTKDIVNDKVSKLQKLISDREVALVGKPSASDQALIDANNVKGQSDTDLINNITGNKTSTVSPTDFWGSLTPTTIK